MELEPATLEVMEEEEVGEGGCGGSDDDADPQYGLPPKKRATWIDKRSEDGFRNERAIEALPKSGREKR